MKRVMNRAALSLVVVVGGILGAWSASRGAAQVTADPLNTVVGPGFSDVSPHQVIRTSRNVLYVVVPDCPGGYPCGLSFATTPNHLHVYKGNRAGVATAFAEMDTVNAPTGGIGSAAIAVDGNDTIHAVWIDVQGTGPGSVTYNTYNTLTDRWNAPVTVLDGNTGWTGQTWDNTLEGVALALDGQGAPHVIYASKSGGTNLHLWYRRAVGGAWSAAEQLDDVPLGNNVIPQHPAVGFTADGQLVVAYLTGSFNYTPDGTVYVRTRSSGGTWGASVAIPDVAMTTIDNGPSLLITPDGREHLTFVSGIMGHQDEIRYWYNAGNGWQGDQQPPVQVTHDPSLGPDGSGGIYLYGHGTPMPSYDGEGANLYSFHKTAGGSWGAWTLYTTGSYDSSVSTRWAQFFEAFPETVDIVYWQDLPGPYTIHAGTIAPPLDTASPVVSLTAPANGTTVRGSSVTVSANASDNVGVASVQFTLDGATLGLPLTMAPYSLIWDTSGVANGAHQLGALAKDAAGNVGAAATVAVTVANAPVITAVTTSNITNNGVTMSWMTSVVASSQVEYGPTTAYGNVTPLDAMLVTAHQQTIGNLSAGTTYHYRVRSSDAANVGAVSNDATFTTTGVLPNHSPPTHVPAPVIALPMLPAATHRPSVPTVTVPINPAPSRR